MCVAVPQRRYPSEGVRAQGVYRQQARVHRGAAGTRQEHHRPADGQQQGGLAGWSELRQEPHDRRLEQQHCLWLLTFVTIVLQFIARSCVPDITQLPGDHLVFADYGMLIVSSITGLFWFLREERGLLSKLGGGGGGGVLEIR